MNSKMHYRPLQDSIQSTRNIYSTTLVRATLFKYLII